MPYRLDETKQGGAEVEGAMVDLGVSGPGESVGQLGRLAVVVPSPPLPVPEQRPASEPFERSPDHRATAHVLNITDHRDGFLCAGVPEALGDAAAFQCAPLDGVLVLCASYFDNCMLIELKKTIYGIYYN